VVVNRVEPQLLPARSIAPAAQGEVDVAQLREGFARAGLELAEGELAGLVTETVQHAARVGTQRASRERLLGAGVGTVELPQLRDGVDLGALYELAGVLGGQGAR
jgi:hypothetical protein